MTVGAPMLDHLAAERQQVARERAAAWRQARHARRPLGAPALRQAVAVLLVEAGLWLATRRGGELPGGLAARLSRT